MQPKAMILSGGPNSVHVADAPQPPAGFFEYAKEQGIPVLGVCYGMQLMVHVSASPNPHSPPTCMQASTCQNYWPACWTCQGCACNMWRKVSRDTQQALEDTVHPEFPSA